MKGLLGRLGHPRALGVLLLVGAVLCSPMLVVGFQLDDVVQQALVASGEIAPIDQFRFARGPEDVATRQHEGLAPWWTDPGLRLAFFRPVAAWTHWLDAKLAPGFFPWHALHTAAWYLAACAAALAVYRRVLGEALPAGAAVLALAVFALDDARGMTIGWLASRNAVIAAAFGFAAVAAHLRERRGLAAVLLLLSLGSSEAGVGTLAYLGAAALFLDRKAWPSLIYALPTALWAALWIGGHHGAAHSDAYVDPVADTSAFLGRVVRNGPLLLASQWTVPLCDAVNLVSPAKATLLARLCLLSVPALGWLLWPLLEDRRARFLLAGSVLALVPVAATVPASRLLLFAGLGASGLLAMLVASAVGRARRLVTGGLVVLHAGLSPLLLPIAILGVRDFGSINAEAWDDALRDPGVVGTTAVALQAPIGLFGGHLPWIRRLRGEPGPDRLYVVGPSLQRSTVARLDERTLRVTVDRGFYPPPGAIPELPVDGLHLVAEALDRGLHDDCRRYPGEEVDVGPFLVHVVETLPDGRPATVDLRFDAPLEDPGLRFVVFEGGRAKDWAPPAVGATVVLPANPLRP